MLAPSTDGRDHIDASWSRALPRQGPGAARHVRRADGQGRGYEPGPRRLYAHRRPQHRDLRCERNRRRRPTDRRRSIDGVPAPGRRWGRRCLLRGRRSGARRIPRGRQPRRGMEAPRDLLVREQRVCRVFTSSDTVHSNPRTTSGGIRRRLRRRRRQRCRHDGRGHATRRRGGAQRAGTSNRRSQHVPLARSLRRGPPAIPSTV